MSAAHGSIVDQSGLPSEYPTHRIAADFWEELGRTVGTFGFLEETLGKAIFSLTATRRYEDSELEAAFEKWLPTLKRAVSDPLGGLINTYGKALKDHPDAKFENRQELIDDLRAASQIRNVICHGSWGLPDAAGRSVPFFVTPQLQIFQTGIDIAFLKQTREHAVGLACSVINSVTHMGWQFPGTTGPGEPVMRSRSNT